MPASHDIPGLDQDPGKILGVSIDADEEEIRAAYLQKIREYPPDRSPEEFEKIRDAYELLHDPRKRARLLFLSVDPGAPLASLLDEVQGVRKFVGPEPWLAAMKEKKT